MAVRKFKPVTAGTRHKILGTFDEITKSTPEKSLLSPKKSTGGVARRVRFGVIPVDGDAQ